MPLNLCAFPAPPGRFDERCRTETVFQPRFAGWAERIRASFDRQGAMTLIGAQLLDLAPGRCSIALVPRAEVSQQHGYMHAADIVAAIVDTAGGYAGLHALSGAQLGEHSAK